jgi:hypothetical protein
MPFYDEDLVRISNSKDQPALEVLLVLVPVDAMLLSVQLHSIQVVNHALGLLEK